MTFGEKLQDLRKQNNMSQEELAVQLNVSRQAVSKWELDASLPDTANVLAIGGLFGVSIDFLLKDTIEQTEILPASYSGNTPDTRRNTAFPLGIGCLALGLFTSCIGWWQYQTVIAAGVGIVLQIVGIVAFELLYRRELHAMQRRWFYAAASWLVCPFFAMALTRIALAFYPNSYAFWVELLVSAGMYLVICGSTTAILLVKGRNHKRQVQQDKRRSD